MSKFLRRSLMIFIIKGFRTIIFIFIVISTMFRPICLPAFFRCFLNSGTYTGLQTTPFIESTGVACSNSVSLLKASLEEHREAIVRGEIEKSGMADHIWKEKGNYLPLWDEVEIIDRAERWRIRRLKESAHMLGYDDLLSRPSIEMNTKWEPIIKKTVRRWAEVKKKNIHNSSNPSQVRTLSLYVQKIYSKLSSGTHSVTVIGIGSLSF